LLPNCRRFPNRGTPGISGRFLILGVSVLFKYLIMKKTTVMTAMPIVWYDIMKVKEEIEPEMRRRG
jgi:hypothetical protein